MRRAVTGRRGRYLKPGMTGTVESMGQYVRVRFPEYPNTIFVLYDGDLALLHRESGR